MVYLDNAATTKLSKKVIEAMMPYYTEEYGNPSSGYALGTTSKGAVENCRAEIGKLIGVDSERVVFTSGATEANNAAIRNHLFRGARSVKNHVVVSSIEHPSVWECLRSYRGLDITVVNAGKNGWIYPSEVEKSIRDDTCLVCVMAANNEMGALQLLPEISKICMEKGIPLHIDATQAIGHTYFNVKQMGIVGDFTLAFSGHKFHAPKGIGCLVTNSCQTILYGGGQENGIRSGTENVPGIVGMTVALENAYQNNFWHKKIKALRECFLAELRGLPCKYEINGNLVFTLPNILNISFKGIDGSELVSMLANVHSIYCSTGSACCSGISEPSRVLTSMGISNADALSAVRFSFSRYNTEEEIKYVARSIKECIRVLLK